MNASIQRREEIDQQLAFTAPAFSEPCSACNHFMIRFNGQCWSDCPCRESKHIRKGEGVTP